MCIWLSHDSLWGMKYGTLLSTKSLSLAGDANDIRLQYWQSIDSHSFVTLYRYTHEHTHTSAVKFWTWIKLSPLPVHTFENILVKGHQPVGKGWWNGACLSTKLWKTRDIKWQGFPLHTSQISYYLLNSSLELAYYMQSLDWATIFLVITTYSSDMRRHWSIISKESG